MILELPHLDPTRCSAAADCVAACPTECLEMDGHRPRLAAPLDCVACALCVEVCPSEALTMRTLEACE